MEVHNSFANVPCILTWGVFDGVHRGHRQVIGETVRWAKQAGLKSVALTFRQHPEAVVKGISPPSLTSLEQRLRMMGELGLDMVTVMDFDKRLAETPPRAFVREILLEKAGARGLVMGFDCRFGKNAAGDYRLLEMIASEEGIEAREVPPMYFRGQEISSTAIRRAILSGDLGLASGMLGRNVSVAGEVVRGDGRGARLGFPTANLRPAHEVHPPAGVYYCLALVEGKRMPAVMSIGTRPTFEDGAAAPVVEVHIIDFSGEMYGQTLEAEVIGKLREQKKFRSAEELSRQIAADVATAREKLAAQT